MKVFYEFCVTLRNKVTNETEPNKIGIALGSSDDEYFKSWEYATSKAKELLLSKDDEDKDWYILSITSSLF